jgi:hypothetical protein
MRRHSSSIAATVRRFNYYDRRCKRAHGGICSATSLPSLPVFDRSFQSDYGKRAQGRFEKEAVGLVVLRSGWRSTAVGVGRGCLIALITYGLRTSFGPHALRLADRAPPRNQRWGLGAGALVGLFNIAVSYGPWVLWLSTVPLTRSGPVTSGPYSG